MNRTLPFAYAGSGLLVLSAALALHASDGARKTHTLFMGVDVTLDVSGERATVREVRPDGITVRLRDRTMDVRTRRRPLELQARPALKLSDTLASVAKIKADRAYTARSDPRRMAASLGDTTSAQVATDMGSAVLSFGANPQSYDADAVALGSYSGSAAAESNYDMLSAAAAATQTAANQSVSATGSAQEGLTQEDFDALLVSFELSSPEVPLEAPFLVTVVDYHRRDARPGRIETNVTARPLPAIGARPEKISFLQGGFPAGYILDGVRLHVFDRGAEVGTTVAPMRSELSEDEAFEYRVIDYVSANRDATLPAAPAPGQLNVRVLDHLRTHYPDRTIYVRVLPTGRASVLFADRAGTKPIDDEPLMTLLREVRFNPALSRGRPVRGLAALQPSGNQT